MTDKEKCLLQREAFGAGYVVGCGFGAYVREDVRRREAAQEAKSRYPLPKVTRPRVVAGLRAQYKVVDGVVFGRSNASFDWRVSASIHVDDVVRVADLLANPTEEVDE